MRRPALPLAASLSLIAVLFGVLLTGGSALKAEVHTLKRAATPVDNPLKGLVPYTNPTPDRFPHSMEFSYLRLNEIMKGPNEFDWQPLEKLLDDVASRGNQTVFRIWMEYPGRKSGIPSHLEEAGLKVTEWLKSDNDPEPPMMIRTPDYADPQLHTALRSFILAMGKKYDGDPRLGYITAGLLGAWGEWHTYPREDLYPTKACQIVVMDAYEKAFPTTPVLLRYPAGQHNYHYAPNETRPLGYHDDSFAWATLDTGREEDEWFFMPAMKEASATDKWKTQPIGGEIRPELWGKIFDAKTGIKGAQDFPKCVKQTHATWLMDTGLFDEQPSDERRRRAIKQVRRMGYDLHIATADIRAATSTGESTVTLTLRNIGIAPFYYDWKVEVAAVTEDGTIAQTWPTDWHVTRLLPGDSDRTWKTTIDVSSLPKGPHPLVVRVVNPLKNGHPLRFANQSQDQHVNGWVTVGDITPR